RHNAHRGAQDSPEFDASYRIFDSKAEPDEAENEETDAPAIVAETRVDIPTASVSDAVMILDLRDTNALMFKNGQTGAYNMVYRRQDGTIGWVEPGQ
ncbi:MAG: 30S ribosomal protein S30, partial [Sphingomonadaceae bacterium]